MKAAITPTYGPANILEIREVPKPTIGEHDVLVQVHASAVTAGDRRLRAADFPGISAFFGRLAMGVFAPRNKLQGTMFAGHIVEVGDAVTDYAVGDDVFGSADHGAYAELLAVPESGNMAKMPAAMTYAEAAAVPYGAITALLFLRDHAELKRGQRVLILGASGGVGRYAVQIAKQMGAEVTGVCSVRNLEAVRDLGADHLIDYASTDFTKNGERYNVIFDIADASSFGKCRNSLTPRGRYLTLYISLRAIFQMLVTGFRDGQKAKFGIAFGDRNDMEQVRSLLVDGSIRPIIAEQFPLERIAEAHAAADSGRAQGSVMVRMRPTLVGGDAGLRLAS